MLGDDYVDKTIQNIEEAKPVWDITSPEVLF